MKNRNEFFNAMADGWDDTRKESDESFRRVVREARIEPGQHILDAGTGTGVLLPYIDAALNGKGKIYAIDYAERMIEKLKTNGFPPTVHPRVSDIHETSFPDASFDRVVANSCYPHFEDKNRALKEIHRVMKDDGFFILSHPTGREYVNQLHRNAHEVVAMDVLPDPPQIMSFIVSRGFEAVRVIDEEEFFLIRFQKN